MVRLLLFELGDLCIQPAECTRTLLIRLEHLVLEPPAFVLLQVAELHANAQQLHHVTGIIAHGLLIASYGLAQFVNACLEIPCRLIGFPLGERMVEGVSCRLIIAGVE